MCYFNLDERGKIKKGFYSVFKITYFNCIVCEDKMAYVFFLLQVLTTNPEVLLAVGKEEVSCHFNNTQ